MVNSPANTAVISPDLQALLNTLMADQESNKTAFEKLDSNYTPETVQAYNASPGVAKAKADRDAAALAYANANNLGTRINNHDASFMLKQGLMTQKELDNYKISKALETNPSLFGNSNYSDTIRFHEGHPFNPMLAAAVLGGGYGLASLASGAGLGVGTMGSLSDALSGLVGAGAPPTTTTLGALEPLASTSIEAVPSALGNAGTFALSPSEFGSAIGSAVGSLGGDVAGALESGGAAANAAGGAGGISGFLSTLGDKILSNPLSALSAGASLIGSLNPPSGTQSQSDIAHQQEADKAKQQQQASNVVGSLNSANLNRTMNSPLSANDYYTYGSRPATSFFNKDAAPITYQQTFAKGGYVKGGGALSGGQDDSVDAKLSNGEFVVPADVVSALGDGANDAGAKKLYGMMDNVRVHKTGRKTYPAKAKPVEKYISKYAKGGSVNALLGNI